MSDKFKVGDTVRGNASGDDYIVLATPSKMTNEMYSLRHVKTSVNTFLPEWILNPVEDAPVENTDLYNLYWNLDENGYSMTGCSEGTLFGAVQALLLSGAEITGIINEKEDN